MKLQVTGHRVLVKPEYKKAETEWGFIQDVGETFKRENQATQIGIVVDVGPNAWLDFKSTDGKGNLTIGKPWAKVGDKVYFARHAGKVVKVSNEEDHVILNDDDIQCVINESEEDGE